MSDESRVQRLGKSAFGTLGGFKTFILRGNVVDLAVGIVIGAAFTTVVNAFVSGIITPLIPAGQKGLDALVVTLPTGSTLKVGAFISAVISFLIVAFVIYYFVVLPTNTLVARFKPKEVPAPATTRDCPYCLSTIPLMATRCPNCTSPIQPPAQASTAGGAHS